MGTGSSILLQVEVVVEGALGLALALPFALAFAIIGKGGGALGSLGVGADDPAEVWLWLQTVWQLLLRLLRVYSHRLGSRRAKNPWCTSRRWCGFLLR